MNKLLARNVFSTRVLSGRKSALSCNFCAIVCETNGKDIIEELAARLNQDGFDITETELLPMDCNIGAVKKSNLF